MKKVLLKLLILLSVVPSNSLAMETPQPDMNRITSRSKYVDRQKLKEKTHKMMGDFGSSKNISLDSSKKLRIVDKEAVQKILSDFMKEIVDNYIYEYKKFNKEAFEENRSYKSLPLVNANAFDLSDPSIPLILSQEDKTKYKKIDYYTLREFGIKRKGISTSQFFHHYCINRNLRRGTDGTSVCRHLSASLFEKLTNEGIVSAYVVSKVPKKKYQHAVCFIPVCSNGWIHHYVADPRLVRDVIVTAINDCVKKNKMTLDLLEKIRVQQGSGETIISDTMCSMEEAGEIPLNDYSANELLNCMMIPLNKWLEHMQIDGKNQLIAIPSVDFANCVLDCDDLKLTKDEKDNPYSVEKYVETMNKLGQSVASCNNQWRQLSVDKIYGNRTK